MQQYSQIERMPTRGQNVPQDVPQEIRQDVPQNAPQDMSRDMSRDVPQNSPEKPQQESEDIELTKFNKIKDLNRDLVNFELRFQVQSKDGKDFSIFVTDQERLDKTKDFTSEYRRSEGGKISGSVRNDDNTLKSYFLVLRSEEPRVCNVYIERHAIPARKVQPSLPPNDNVQKYTQQIVKQGTNWTKIIFVLVCIGIGGYILYTFFYKKKSEKSKYKFYSSPSSRRSSLSSKDGVLQQLKKLNVK
jgi:hypothetical protein